MSTRPHVELYCDGACLGNPGPGGWAYLLRLRSLGGIREKECAGSEAETTNNRMELSGAIKGLDALTWRKADRQPVMNADLWQELDRQLQKHRVEARWVRGHAGHPENERVDRLASEAAKTAAARK